jgi:hypothetical protein
MSAPIWTGCVRDAGAIDRALRHELFHSPAGSHDRDSTTFDFRSGDDSPPRHSGELFEDLGRSVSNVSILALGLMPVLTGYWLVEVFAFFLPPLRRLRHANPEGRAKLDRAARFVALVFASAQAYFTAQGIQAMAIDGVGFRISVPLVALTLVAGVCIQFVAARIITERGLGNGLVVLTAASALHHFVGESKDVLHRASRSTQQLWRSCFFRPLCNRGVCRERASWPFSRPAHSSRSNWR